LPPFPISFLPSSLVFVPEGKEEKRKKKKRNRNREKASEQSKNDVKPKEEGALGWRFMPGTKKWCLAGMNRMLMRYEMNQLLWHDVTTTFVSSVTAFYS